ncbi:TetR/AcrR family transcriptional regulator [Nocardia crassostreae]|uniref:TetR/AcrR family transcriptional regulator n=1 Tax=Nocardia crassostreae TaxID=53428 RepID=UPI00082A563E|nr:TetR/AcrR family transcriptional regulator [Nocardia crassostreae]
MARPRAFDEDRAVDAAMRAFWTTGYEGTSTQALCAATGLGRSSIYNTFASKHDLFERALRHYMNTKNDTIFELLHADTPAREKIRALLWQVIDAPEDDPVGCLVVNSLVELAPHDPEIAALLRADERRRLDTITDVIRGGQRDGDFGNTGDARDLARFVMATIGGMRVTARGGADRETLNAIATTALNAL